MTVLAGFAIGETRCAPACSPLGLHGGVLVPMLGLAAAFGGRPVCVTAY
jgi:hypothetical protein